jgi:beta-glucosidase
MQTPSNGHHPFPPHFLWGVAMAAYQVEGAVTEDGRGESIWDRFCRTDGSVRNGDSGTVACDFYHRYPEDIALMRDLGVTALRFSVAWPRVLPEGRGRVNGAGLDFYDRLVDELLEHGIEPLVTLYHWDLPVALEDAGGWPRRSTVDAFCEFTAAVAARLGDRVTRWITQNEPWVVAWLGYGQGEHAPGRRSTADALAAGHHVLLSHGLATSEIRRYSPGAQVGIAIDVNDVQPATRSPADVAAAREHDGERNRWFLDPVFRASYPADVAERFAPYLPAIADGDMAVIATPIDFLGLNYYRREVVARSEDGGHRILHQDDSPYTDMGWEISPTGLTDVLVRMRDEYAPAAIHITENGAAFEDVRGHDGEVRDPERQAYLASHLDAVARAIALGVPVEGYFAWSLLDNFEWARGYSKRFGLVYLDYPTLDRIPKSSFSWYRDFIAGARTG